MIPSPYTPGTTPTVFVGRAEQLESARADLAVLATYGRFLGRVRVDIGSRGVGKTSLLKAVRDAALEAGAVVAWVTARGDESLVGALVHEVARGLDAIGVDAGRGSWRDRVRTLTVELGALGATAGVELDLGPDGAGSGGSGGAGTTGTTGVAAAASSALADLVAAGSAAARERGSAGLVLLVDEIQAAPRADLRTLAYAWQELQGAVPEPAAAVFAVGLPNAPDVLTAAVTFSERFAFRTLARLGATEAGEVLTGPAAGEGVSWHPDLLAAVVDRADGYPYFLQLYGDAVWRAAAPAEGDVLEPGLIDVAARRVGEELDTMFRARWAKASPGERRMLVAMAGLTPAPPDPEAPVRRADVAAAMGVSSNDLSVARRSLLDKGLIEVAERGTVRFTVPGFAAFVRDEAG